jgi:predicted nucleic acid-binding protein
MTGDRPEGASGFQFLDTNILVYAHDRSAGLRHQLARALLESLWESGNGCVSIQVLQEYHVTVTRKVPRPLSIQASAQVISGFRYWRVHTPQAEDVIAAIRLQQQVQSAFWDAMIVQSALQLGCSVLWSEDFNVGQRYGLTQVHNPFT